MCIRDRLHYADIPYKYKMVWDHYGSSWAEVKKDIIFNRLPILIINEDKYLWQSNTIIRYLSNLTKTKPSDEFQLAYCDAVFESTHEMFSPLNPTINMTFGEKYNSNKKKLFKYLNKFNISNPTDKLLVHYQCKQENLRLIPTKAVKKEEILYAFHPK